MGIGMEETTTGRLCRRCGEPVRVIGDDPLLPPSLRKAEHEDGSETCAGTGDVAAPFDPGNLADEALY
jgi:hypothetical protein